jgi:hypothetical protein
MFFDRPFALSLDDDVVEAVIVSLPTSGARYFSVCFPAVVPLKRAGCILIVKLRAHEQP